ncbi:MAG: DUF2892 domain-containing protein [Aquificae bacterium]|nr:DUF2892 domain-containing protein [Aquificota bacterium]
MAWWDAIIRVLIGSILAWLGMEKGGAWIIAQILGIVLILTAIFGFCPLYKITGISTKEQQETQTA